MLAEDPEKLTIKQKKDRIKQFIEDDSLKTKLLILYLDYF